MIDGRQPYPYGIAPPGFRLPDDTRVGTVQLQIADLDRSLGFYRDLIGLQVLERSATAARLGVEGSNRPLVALRALPGARPAARRGRFGLFHFAVLLPDRAELGRFAGRLVRTGPRFGMADHLVSEALYLTDPDGLGVEVYADRPRPQWRHRDRQLTMTTDPLDLADLVSAGQGMDWDVAPRGTTVGHMHLHVGDLERADAFYHAALGFDRTVWHYPGARFFSAGGYHHHLGTNTWSPGPAPADDEARLLAWELVLPAADRLAAAAESLEAAGYAAHRDEDLWRAADPWGTQLQLTT